MEKFFQTDIFCSPFSRSPVCSWFDRSVTVKYVDEQSLLLSLPELAPRLKHQNTSREL